MVESVHYFIFIKTFSLSQISGADLSKVLVLVGPYEHHSNMLPWRENKDCVLMEVQLNEAYVYNPDVLGGRWY